MIKKSMKASMQPSCFCNRCQNPHQYERLARVQGSVRQARERLGQPSVRVKQASLMGYTGTITLSTSRTCAWPASTEQEAVTDAHRHRTASLPPGGRGSSHLGATFDHGALVKSSSPHAARG